MEIQVSFLLQPLAETQQCAENNIGVLMAAAARDDKELKTKTKSKSNYHSRRPVHPSDCPC